MENEDQNKSEQEEQDQEPKKDIPLFRKEALEHKKGSFLGKVTIASPISFTIWASSIFVIAIIIILFITFGKFSKHRQAVGVLVPNKGLINVYARSPGIVVEKLAKQGDTAIKDQPIYLISTEMHNPESQGVTAQLVESLEKQVILQKNKLSSLEKTTEKYKKLLDEHFVSEQEYQNHYNLYLEAEINLRQIEQQLIDTRNKINHAVLSPASGTISTLVAMIGDRVVAEKPLASIIPEGAKLQGILFVRPHDIGFIKLGQKVLLKYDAYPYQNFGLYESTVVSIDESVLSQKDLDMPVPPQENANPYYNNQTFYRVTVDLKDQNVMVYGKAQPLTAGMTIKGEIIGDKRTIWQWILDPIYTLRGSLISQ